MRGGKRAGAGRPKKGNRTTITVRISALAAAKLKWACIKLDLSQSEFIERQLKGI